MGANNPKMAEYSPRKHVVIFSEQSLIFPDSQENETEMKEVLRSLADDNNFELWYEGSRQYQIIPKPHFLYVYISVR